MEDVEAKLREVAVGPAFMVRRRTALTGSLLPALAQDTPQAAAVQFARYLPVSTYGTPRALCRERTVA